MAGKRGKDLAYLKIGTTKLGNIKGDLNISFSNAEIDVRDDSSNGYNEVIQGDQTITISGSYNYQLENDQDAAQTALTTAGTSNTIISDVKWAFEEVAGSKEWTADAIVTEFGGTNGDPQTISFTLRITEKPVESAQS